MAQRRSSDEVAAIVGCRTLVPLDGGVLVRGLCLENHQVADIDEPLAVNGRGRRSNLFVFGQTTCH